MTAVQIAEPTGLAVSIEYAKAHVRALSGVEDQLVDGYLRAALAHIEKSISRCFLPQEWELTRDDYPSTPLLLEPRPVAGIVSITHLADDVDVILEDTLYRIGPLGLVPVTTWPAGSNVRIRFTAGLGLVPADIKQAVLLLAAFFYDNRDAATPLPSLPIEFGVEALIGRHRRYFI